MLPLFLALSRQEQICSPRYELLQLDNDNWSTVIGKDRPVLARLVNAECPYARASEKSWKLSQNLHPNVQFVEIECIKNHNLCSHFGATHSPSYAIFEPNSEEPLATVGNLEVFNIPSGFNWLIKEYLGYYPIDTPPVQQLFPFSTNAFYESHRYPIFMLYNSSCSYDNEFIAKWIKASNEELFPEDVDYGFGLLDCSQMKDECIRWGGETPSVAVCSRETGNRATISSTENIKNKVEAKLKALDEAEYRETPQPIPPPKGPEQKPIPEDGDNIKYIRNPELQSRTIASVKTAYLNAIKKSYDGKAYTAKNGQEMNDKTPNIELCEDISLRKEDIEDTIKIINFYRNHAGIKEVVKNANSLNDNCYETAKFYVNSSTLTHDPNDYLISKSCNPGARDAIKSVARNSNIAKNHERVPQAISGFIKDLGVDNRGVIGHRRWILYPYLSEVGIGFYPYSKVQHSNVMSWEYYSATVLQIKTDGQEIKQTPYTANTFTAWPPPGPFPYPEFPESFTLYYPEIANSDITEKDIKVVIAKDDGTEIKTSQIKIDRDIKGFAGQLIIELSQEGRELCTPLHDYSVKVFINKANEKLCVDYSFYLFNTDEQEEICFYETNKNKCPTDIDDKKKFGASEYNNYNTYTDNNVIVHIAEPIKPQKPLVFDFSPQILIKDNEIQGTIYVGSKTKLEISKPEKTHIVLQATIDGDLKVGSIVTSLKPQNLTVELTGTPNNENLLRSLVYEGPVIPISFTSNPVVLGDYTYYLSSYYDGKYITITTTGKHNIVAIIFNDAPIKEDVERVTVPISNFEELKKFSTKKRLIRIYLRGNEIMKATDLPKEVHDYQIRVNGKVEFYNDYSHYQYINSIDFDKYPTRFRDYNYEIKIRHDSKLGIFYDAQMTVFKNITITNVEPEQFYSDVMISPPGLKGTDAAKEQFQNQNYNYYREYHEEKDFKDGDFEINNAKNSWTRTPVFMTTGNAAKYTIRKNSNCGKTAALYAFFVPEEGTEDKVINFELNRENSASYIPCFLNYKHVNFITNDPDILISPSFTNVSKVTYDYKSTLPVYEKQISDTFVSGDSYDLTPNGVVTLKYTNLHISDNTVITATGTESKNLYANSCNPTVKGMIITNTIKLENSEIVLDDCTVKASSQITLTKNSVIKLVGGSFVPSAINVDMEIQQYRKLLEGDQSQVEDKEKYAIITGLSDVNINEIKDKVRLTNQGDYKVYASKDKTTIYLISGDVKDDDLPESIPEQENNEDAEIDPVTPIPIPDPKPEENETQDDEDAGKETEDAGKETEDSGKETKESNEGNDNDSPSIDNQGQGENSSSSKSLAIGLGVTFGLVAVAAICAAIYFLVLKDKNTNEVDIDENPSDGEVPL